jgi:AcrR family transcriptional regulator
MTSDTAGLGKPLVSTAPTSSRSAAPIERAPPFGNVKATRGDWLALALSVLAAEGVAHVTVLNLSERLDVSRSSFYWYFKNRDELLDALLDRWDKLNTRSILSQAESPALTVNQAVCNVFRCWFNPAIFSPRLDFAVREWARRSANVRIALDLADRERTEALKALFIRFGYEDEDALVRARVLYYMQIGYYALDIREPIEARLNLTPHYLKGFTGVAATEAEVEALRTYAARHAHVRDFGPSRDER